MDKSLDHAKFLIRNYLTNIVYYVIMKNRTKKTCLKNAPLLRNLAFFIVAGIETRRTRYIRRHFGLRSVDDEIDI